MHWGKQQQHTHDWKEVGRKFVQSLHMRNVSKIKAKDDDTLERLLFGVTVIELVCKTCGEIGRRELKGDHT